ncbi:hypothetical protein RFI_08064 [Reticulomyxa filosa]|uniref:TLC domain-containing protein n=1 Tax=Reticulomyxa filosa TaxID=46433 RepID=X6NST3_RETFI|nr:hypothetical protein RFI_08064 [Reticulomyxa filosa]|eukprot:ETO29061.1 hypothetical protein RFI_08064 [Reticulomyxa filosa]
MWRVFDIERIVCVAREEKKMLIPFPLVGQQQNNKGKNKQTTKATLITIWRYCSGYLMRPIAQHFAQQHFVCKIPSFLHSIAEEDEWKLKNMQKLCFNEIKQQWAAVSSMTNSNSKSHHHVQTHRHHHHHKTAEEEIVKSSVINPKKNKAENAAFINFIHQQTGFEKSQIMEYWSYYVTTLQSEEFVQKYIEELWKVFTVLLIMCTGIYVMSQEDVLYAGNVCYTRWPQHSNRNLKFYYQLSFGYHLHRVVYQLFDTQRSDFVIMMIHHCITVVLIFSSYFFGLMEVGGLVMAVHDNADFFLAGAKTCIYSNEKFGRDLCFGAFVLSWIVVRIFVFSWKVLYPLTFQTTPMYSCRPLHMIAFQILLYLLLVCSSFFFSLLLFQFATKQQITNPRCCLSLSI